MKGSKPMSYFNPHTICGCVDDNYFVCVVRVFFGAKNYYPAGMQKIQRPKKKIKNKNQTT